jgi:DNA-binding response OmpR family regulator
MGRATLRQEETEALDPGRVTVHPPHVLLAEHDAELRHELTLGLVESGYEVVQAADGRAALDRLGTHVVRNDPPELIIADLRLPGCSGPT